MVSLNIQEREEQRALNNGMSRSIWGLLLCWLPLVGLLLSIIGFLKVAVRVTQQHRVRYVAFFTLSFIILAINIGTITGGIWVLTQRSEWVQDAKVKVLSALQLNDYLNPAPFVPEDNYNEGGYYEGNYNEGEYIDPNSPDGMILYDDMQYDENGYPIEDVSTDIIFTKPNH